MVSGVNLNYQVRDTKVCYDLFVALCCCSSHSLNCSTSSSNTASFSALLSYAHTPNSRPRPTERECWDGLVSRRVLLSEAVRPPSTTSGPAETTSLAACKTKMRGNISSYFLNGDYSLGGGGGALWTWQHILHWLTHLRTILFLNYLN